MISCIFIIERSTIRTRNYCSFACTFVWSFSSHSRILHSYEDVPITGEGLPILNYARHLWPLSSRVLQHASHTCHTRHLFIMVIFEDPQTLTLNAERLAVELIQPVLTTSVCRGWDSNTYPFARGLIHCDTASATIARKHRMLIQYLHNPIFKIPILNVCSNLVRFFE